MTPMSRVGRRPLQVVLCIAVLATVAVVAAACTGGDDKAEGKKPSTTTTSPDCVISDPPPVDAPEGAAESTTTSILQKCLDATFKDVIEGKGSEALKKLGAERQMALGQGLCAYAQALAADPTNLPRYSSFIESTAKSWDVKEAVVEEMVGAADALCPGKMNLLKELESNVGAVELSLEVTGGGTLSITFTGPDGTEVADTATTPWMHVVRFDQPTDFELHATAESGEVACTVMADDDQVTSNTAEAGKTVSCSASADDIRKAMN